MRGVLGDDPLLKDQVQTIIRSVDADDSGTIDFDEFLTLMLDPRFKDLAKDEHREAFEMFDKDSNGHISIAELKDAFRGLGKFLPAQELSSTDPHLVLGQRLDDDEFDAILREADLDGDSHIDYEEFLQVGSHPTPPFFVCAMAHPCIQMLKR